MKRVLIAAALTLLMPAASRAACTTISATGLSFGSYDGAALANSTAAVTIGCSTAFAYSVGLDAGVGAGASAADRKMSSGARTLTYRMFQDVPRSTNWGNILNGDARSGTTTAADTILTVYASLLPAQYPTPGTYSDTITATALNSGNIQATFVVQATVQAACTISASALNFGIYAGSQTDATSVLTITCTNTTPYYVNLNGGLSSDSDSYPRMRSAAGAFLGYRLYQDSGRTLDWRDTENLNGQAATGSGAPQYLTVYGRVLAGQYSATPGAYSDMIVAKVTY